MTDALGSTLALTNSTGTVQTSYSFEPFGNTTQSGSSSTNSFAYTGRELDAGNLYYYRARYYHAQLQRFISEDPLRFIGGVDFYTYVHDSPLNLTDPFGLKDYNEQETLQLLQQAYQDATAGYFSGLGNIFEHHRGWRGVFERNCGAMTPYTRVVSIRHQGSRFDGEDDRSWVFMLKDQPTIRVSWSGQRQLIVETDGYSRTKREQRLKLSHWEDVAVLDRKP